MEIKGRVKGLKGPEERMKKDQSGTYTILEVDVQIGTYSHVKADYHTQTFETVDEAEMIRATYFGDEARNKAEMLAVGDVVSVKMHHYVNNYGRTETVIDSIVPCNAKEQAMQKAQAKAAAPAAAAQAAADDLPF